MIFILENKGAEVEKSAKTKKELEEEVTIIEPVLQVDST
jgi:hypothetical protein